MDQPLGDALFAITLIVVLYVVLELHYLARRQRALIDDCATLISGTKQLSFDQRVQKCIMACGPTPGLKLPPPETVETIGVSGSNSVS